MNVLDIVSSSNGALRAHARRTLLSLVGMSIGVAAVVVLTGLGEGGRDFVRRQFEIIGTNVVAVLPGKVETSGAIPGLGGVPNDLTIADAEALARGLPQAESVAPVYLGNDTIAHGERSRQVLVFGSTAEVFPIRKLRLRSGTFLPPGHWDRGGNVAVIGPRLATELFVGENPLGKNIRIGDFRMRVIGVLANQGMHFGVDLDETVFVPVATALRIFDRTSLFRVVMQLRPGADPERAKERCAAILRERHGEEDFTITTPDAVLSSLESILAMLTLVLVGIASVSLAVAGIGIMNVMLVSVSERTQEIGLLKALGATRGQVLSLFLAEAAILSVLGGALGLLIAALVLRTASLVYPGFPVSPPPWAMAASLGLAVVVGIVFGLLPAIRAIRLDPIAALSGR